MSDPASLPAEPAPRGLSVIIPLWLMVMAASSQVMIVSPILPRIGSALSVPDSLLGTLVTGYAISLAVFALVAGPISDYVGRRRILLWGMGLMTGALVLHGLATSFTSLLAARVLAGAAGGVLTGSAVSYVGDYFPYQRRGWAAGWVMSGFSVGQILGVPAGTLLADAAGFRAPFLLFAGMMGFAFLMTLVFVPQPDVERSSVLGVRSSVAGYVSLVRRREVLGAAFAFGTMFFAISMFLVYMPTWGEATLAMTAGDIAIMFGVGGVASMAFGPQAGRMSDRFGRKPLIILSCIASSVLFASLTSVVVGRWSAWAVFFVAMGLLALRLSPFQALLTALSDGRQRGSLMALVVSVGQLGGGLGAAAAGIVYAQSGYLGCTLGAAGSLLVTAVLVHRRLPEPQAIPPGPGTG